jgi:MFS transporter, DHA1 family, multidrug resistance protein
MFSSQLGQGIIVPLLPLYAEKMGASGIWIGLVFAGFSISQTILVPFFGALSDRRGRKALLSVGLLSYSVISLGYIWAPDVYQLTLVRLASRRLTGHKYPLLVIIPGLVG